MIEQLKYINHQNEVLDFGKNGLYVNESELHDFTWKVTSKNDRISDFTKGVTTKSMPVVIICDNEEDGINKRNSLFQVCEKDTLKKKHGKLYCGDFYLKCFVTESKKKKYLQSKRSMNVTLKLTTDFPMWVKETTTTFGYGSGHQGTNLDFNNDFPMDYTSNLLGTTLVNNNFVESNFVIRIYGACENPSITIAGHEYSVAVSLEVNEYLTIDSTEKTIVKTFVDGTTQNCFNLRNKDSYIFEKIPVGVSNVLSGSFKFDVTILEERGEPIWN